MISTSLTLLQRVKDIQDGVLIAFSGGKDSVVVLDLCASVFSRVELLFMYLVPGLGIEERDLQYYARFYRAKVHRVPHWSLPRFLKSATLRVPTNEICGSVRAYTERELFDHVREKTGLRFVAGGHRMADSLQRRGWLHSNQGIDEKNNRVFPIWDWSTRDVMAYIRSRKIRVPEIFFSGLHGVSLKPAALKVLRDKYPEDYKKLLRVFPLAETQIVRWGVINANKEKARRARADQRAAFRRAEKERQAALQDADASAQPT